MRKKITISMDGNISEKALEEYYNQLWIIIKDLYGYDILKEIYTEIYNQNK